MSLHYPLTATPIGDLALSQTPNETVESRIRLFLDVAPGDRPMRPDFGSRLQPYLPATFDAVQAESLRIALERFCKADNEVLVYKVTSRSNEVGSARLQVSYAIGDVAT